jgi:hypothetical protein
LDDSKLDNQINWWNEINSTSMTDDVYFIPNYVQVTVKSFAFSRKEFSEKQRKI